MKKWMRKLCRSSLVLTVVLSLMMSVTALAEGDPAMTVTGIPDDEVKIGDTVTLEIKLEGAEEYENLSYSLTGPFGESGFVEGDIDEGTATIQEKVQKTDLSEEECYLVVSGDDKDGDYVFGIFEKKFTLKIAQPKLTIVSGVPEGTVYADMLIEVGVKAENLEPGEKYIVYTSGLSDSDEVVEIKEDEVAYVRGRVSSYGEEKSSFSVILCKVTGSGEWDYEEVCETESSYYEVLQTVRLTNLKWNYVKEMAAGTAYPFSVTVENLIDEDNPGLVINTGASAHVDGLVWEPQVTYTPQEGITVNEYGDAVIGNLKAHTSATIEGTITFPKEAVGDSTYLRVALFGEGDSNIDYLRLSDNNDDIFSIVDAASSLNPGNSQGNGTQDANIQNAGGQKTNGQAADARRAAQTGDSTPLLATITVMMIAAAIVVITARKRHMN